MTPATPEPPATSFGLVARWARRPLLRAFRVTPESRRALVRQMIERHVHDAPMYWLQLGLAMGIATLGLALGSNVVVIGAMLISPLMTPILELGMGLAMGSLRLSGRSFARVVASAGIVVVGATLITLVLPFHEVTSPIAARASPTALDLLVAIGCALMASFTIVTGSTGAAPTAAGTAVAIALVPPLCVVGFGLGTGQTTIARGAGLLFTANFSAIMLVALLTFTAFGFGDDNVVMGTESATSLSGSDARVRSRAFGIVLRLLLPLTLLGIVFVPLRGALEEVAWEVRTRQAVQRELDTMSNATVRSVIDVAGHVVRVQLVIVGDPKEVPSLQHRLALRIAAAAGVVPKIDILAVPNEDVMRAEVALAQPPKAELIPHEPDLQTTISRLAGALGRRWPVSAAGELVDWHLAASAGMPVHVQVVHFGAALGDAACQILGRDLSEAVGQEIAVDDVALAREPLAAPRDRGTAWLAQTMPIVRAIASFETLHACIGMPIAPAAAPDGGAAGDAGAGGDTRSAAETAVVALLGDRASIEPGPIWSFQVQTTPCARAVEDGVTDAGIAAVPVGAVPDAGSRDGGRK